MKNKHIFALLILCLAVLTVNFVCADDSSGLDNKTTLNITSENPVDLKVVVLDMKNQQGLDNDTLAWMDSLGSKQVFITNDKLVIMSKEDASSIPSKHIDRGYMEEFIKCNIAENRSLGNFDGSNDVLLVENVSYVGCEIHSL